MSDDNVIPFNFGQSGTDQSESKAVARVREAIRSHSEPYPEFTVNVGGYSFKYRPEYETFFIQRASECGASLTAISAEIGIPFAVIRYWARKIPALAVALDISRQNAQYYWEDLGRENILDRRFNAAGWLKMMAIQFPQTWRELEPEARIVEPDPYGFEKELDDDAVNAEVNAQLVFERLLRIKEAEEEKRAHEGA